jgi:beta-xylosidase
MPEGRFLLPVLPARDHHQKAFCIMTSALLETFASAASRDGLPHRVNDTVLVTNPLHRYCADPNLAIFDNRYFLYCTDDGVDDWGSTAFSVYVSDDLASWERHPALDLRDVPWWDGSDGAWAPSIMRSADGKYVFYFVAGSQVGAAVADIPYGPFVPEREPMVRKGTFDCHTIDPGAYMEDDGTRYVLWGNGKAWIAPLRDDCLSFDESRAFGWVPGDFREAIWIHKRHGVYYASWSENDARSPQYCVKYAMGASLRGPWSEPRMLLEQDPSHGLYATGHHNIVNIPGTDEWIIAYHRFAYSPEGRWPGGDGCHREVVFAPLVHNPDDTLEPVRPQVGSYIRPLSF